MSGAGKENARTLADLLGVSEERAQELLCRNVLITNSDEPEAKRLAEYIRTLLCRTFAVVDQRQVAKTSYAVEVVVGECSPNCDGADVPLVFAVPIHEGVWVGTRSPALVRGECHDLILRIAACYAAAAAARQAIPELPFPQVDGFCVSEKDLMGDDARALREGIDLGIAHLAGAGAIGNWVLWAMQALQIRGRLHVCDVDTVSSGNLNRCAFFDDGDIGHNKAEVLCREAQAGVPHLELVPFGRRLQDFPPTTADGRTFERLIVGVDSRRARRALQLEFPREVFDASTTGVKEIVLHFNRLPLAGACLGCIYKEDDAEAAHEKHIAEVLGVTIEDVRSNWVTESAATKIRARYPSLSEQKVVGEAYDSLFKALCGQDLLRLEGEKQVLAPFGFVSALAGTMLVLEIARRIHAGSTTEPFNYWRLSPWTAPVIRLRSQRPRLKECEFCGAAVYLAGKAIWERNDDRGEAR